MRSEITWLRTGQPNARVRSVGWDLGHLGSSTSNQEEVKTGFTSLPETTKNMKQWFSRHWPSGNKGQRSLNTANTSDESCDGPALLPWEGLPATVQRQGHGRIPAEALSQGTGLNPGRLRRLELTAHSAGEQRRGKDAERGLQGSADGPLTSSAECREPRRVCGDCMSPRRTRLKRSEGVGAGLTQGQEMLVPLARLSHLTNRRASGKVLRRALLQQ